MDLERGVSTRAVSSRGADERQKCHNDKADHRIPHDASFL